MGKWYRSEDIRNRNVSHVYLVENLRSITNNFKTINIVNVNVFSYFNICWFRLFSSLIRPLYVWNNGC